MTQKPAGDLTEIQQKVMVDTRQMLQSKKGPSSTLSAFGGGEVPVQNVAARLSLDDPTVHNIELTVQNEGNQFKENFINII